MKNFIVYNAAGTILRTGNCQDETLAYQAYSGETVMEGTANDATQYIVAGVVTDKPVLGSAIDKTDMLANGVEVATISGLPNPTQALILGGGSNQNVTVIDGTLELTFDLAGIYKVILTAINKLPQEYLINAT